MAGGADANWSSVANWSPDALPAEGDNLTFSGTTRQNNTNNVLTTVGLVTFSTGGYTVSGTALTLNSGLANSISSGTTTWNLNATLGSAQSFTHQFRRHA